MQSLTLWVVVTLTPALLVLAGGQLHASSLLASRDANQKNTTPLSEREVPHDVKEVGRFRRDFEDWSDTKSSQASGNERTGRENSMNEEEEEEEDSASYDENIDTPSNGRESTLNDEVENTSSPTTISTSLEVTSNSSGSSSSASDDVSTAFPASRAPEPEESSGPRQFGQVIRFIFQRLGLEQKYKSVIQVLFFHVYVISFFYLFVVLHQGVMHVIDLLRTPLLIYKEVEKKEDVMGYPAPTMPPINKDYGYTGGFKTPEGQKIEYMPYPAPKKEPKKPDASPKPEKPMKSSKKEEKPAPMPEHMRPIPPGNAAPPQGGPPGPMFAVFHPQPNGGFGPNPQLPGGGGGGASSYVSYAGQQFRT